MAENMPACTNCIQRISALEAEIDRLTAIDNEADEISAAMARYHHLQPMTARLGVILWRATEPLSRSAIMARLWRVHPPKSAEGAVSVQINRLRTFLGRDAILSPRKKGYVFSELGRESFAEALIEIGHPEHRPLIHHIQPKEANDHDQGGKEQGRSPTVQGAR